MSLPGGDFRTRPHHLPCRHWQQASANGSRQPDHPEEPTMTNFISNATAALVVAAYGIASMTMYGAVIAGALGA